MKDFIKFLERINNDNFKVDDLTEEDGEYLRNYNL